jgi:kinesin family protein 20
MIVNVNPYDTGYDENSHVMKFAALAREVYVSPAPAPMLRPPGTSSPQKGTSRGPFRVLGNVPAPCRRKVTISMGGGQTKISEAVVEVLEGKVSLLHSL